MDELGPMLMLGEFLELGYWRFWAGRRRIDDAIGSAMLLGLKLRCS
jgi:hypothetical protein